MDKRVVSAAVAAIALITFWVSRRGPLEPDTPPAEAAATQPGSPVASAAPTPPAAGGAPAVDVGRVVQDFAAARQRLAPGEWTVVRDVPILERGALGRWDDQSLSVPVVLLDEGAGARYRMWFRGCHMAIREFACGVGHARSADGIVWEKTADPVFVPADPSLQKSLDEVAVVKFNGRYYLWYSVMLDYFEGRRRAALYFATSADGLAWKDEGRVLESSSDNPPSMAHAVVHDGQRFHLWYVSSTPGEGRTPIKTFEHLSSPDGKAWTAMGSVSLQEAMETPMTPELGRFIVETVAGGGFRAFSYASALRSMTSPDGTTWTIADIDEGPLKGWRREGVEVHSLSAARDREGLWFWMDIRSTPDEMRVGVAFMKGS